MNWEEKLTFWDRELFRMVESLTQRPCHYINGGDHFVMWADYFEHPNPEFIFALWDAIEGRAGERLLDLDDDPERHSLKAKIRFSENNNPSLIYCDREEDEQPDAGTPYYSKTDDANEILAVQVERTNGAQLLAFVGNGALEIEKRLNGKAWFHFKNASRSVYADAPEHSFIIYRGPGLFEIMDEETFKHYYQA